MKSLCTDNLRKHYSNDYIIFIQKILFRIAHVCCVSTFHLFIVSSSPSTWCPFFLFLFYSLSSCISIGRCTTVTNRHLSLCDECVWGLKLKTMGKRCRTDDGKTYIYVSHCLYNLDEKKYIYIHTIFSLAQAERTEKYEELKRRRQIVKAGHSMASNRCHQFHKKCCAQCKRSISIFVVV